MFGSIGIPEIILIFVVVLLLFGPNKLPDFAKNFGKAVREFRKTLNEAKSTIEQEIDKADISRDIKEVNQDIQEVNQDIQKIARMDIEDDNQPKQ
jgi:sec-independent protein translocase protein TatA